MAEQSPRMEWGFPSREDDPWYDSFKDFVIAVDGSGFAHREDRSLIWSGGGTISWNLASETFEWTDLINVYSPMSAKLMQIVAGSVVDWAEGEVVYIDLTRLALVNVTKVFQKATALPSTDDAMAFGVRIGDTIFLRTGLSIGDGDSVSGVAPVPGLDSNAIHVNVDAEISGIALKAVPTISDLIVIEDAAAANAKKRVTIGTLPGLATDRYGAGIIVGNGPNGDTANVCHALDVGDGVVLKSTIEAAIPGTDVVIRPGVYDFTSGSVVAPITVPAGVRVRGSGRGHTFIVTHNNGDQRAFRLLAGAELWDSTVNVSLPLASCTSVTVVEMTAERSECHRVKVGFLGAYTAVEAGWSSLTSCFGMDPAGANLDSKLIDCEAGDRTNPMPSFIDLAGKPAVQGLAAVQQGLITGLDENTFIVDRLVSHGGDLGVVTDSRMRLFNSSIYTPFLYGVWIGASACEIAKNEIRISVTGPEAGIYIDSGNNNGIEGNKIFDIVPSSLGTAILLNTALGNMIQRNYASGWQYGVDIPAGSNGNIVLGNQMSSATTPSRDLGIGNDLAHNF